MKGNEYVQIKVWYDPYTPVANHAAKELVADYSNITTLSHNPFRSVHGAGPRLLIEEIGEDDTVIVGFSYDVWAETLQAKG